MASPRTHRIPRPLGAGALLGVLVACLGALSAFAFLHVARASAEQITVGPEGDVWFTEPGVNAIGRITPQGSITQFPIATPDSAPSEIATGPDGDLWFTQAQADEIGSITPEGTIRELRVRTPSVGIAAGREGNIWFAEQSLGPATIGRLTPGGALRQFRIGRAYSELSSLAVGPEGDVWFTDLSFESLGRMTPAGAVTMFPLRRFQSASDVVAGADGGIWFTIDGDSTADAAIGHIGASGAVAETPVPGDDVILRGIAAGPEGSIWFADSLEDKIRQIAPDGVLSETEVPGIPEGVAAAPGGDIWFTEFPGTRIGMITPQGIVSEFPIPRLPRCIVPNLWGKTLVQAHRALRRADCKLGRIRRAHGRPRRPPRVVMQAPYATAVYPRGAAVSIRLR